jgi:ubiquinone biosynthesis monooxygenase Coq7
MKWIEEFDYILRALSGVSAARRESPAAHHPVDAIATDVDACRHAAGLMRVNHVGEICAQALYQSQRLAATTPALRQHFAQAGQEEQDHLAWCALRLAELNAQPSLLNPLWYAGAFGFGLLAGYLGEGFSLGFVEETERQVAAHLETHLTYLPVEDRRSRAIVEQMRKDEITHGQAAREAGAQDLPKPVRMAMRVAAKVMTTIAYRV